MKSLKLLCISVISFLFCFISPTILAINKDDTMGFSLQSSAFSQGQAIPKQYSCDADDISPPLSWTGTPANTQSFVLIVDDPDAPGGVWDHWVLFNIPSSVGALPENVPQGKTLPDGSQQGKNSWNKFGYGGPCPPHATHRYIFKLYALDATLKLSSNVSKNEVLKAMQGHVLAQAELMGKYTRK